MSLLKSQAPLDNFVSNGVRFAFLVGLFLLPFIFWPQAEVPYEIPRVWFVQRWVEVLGVAGVAGGLWVLKRRKADVVLICLVLAFSAVAVASSLQGVDFGKSFWGNFYRGDGLFTLFHLVGFFFFLVLFWNPSWRRKMALAVASGSFLVALWTIFQAARLYVLQDASVENWNGAIGATFGQPKFLGGYLLVTLPFMAYLAKTTDSIRLATFWKRALVFVVLAIAVSGAWAAIIGVVLFIGLWLIFVEKWMVGRLAALLLVGVVVAGGILVWQAKPKFPLNRDASLVTYHPESRERIIVKGFRGFLQQPILGWGWANFDYAFDSNVWPIKLDNDVYVDKAHSTLLEVLVTTGVVGLAAYLGLVGWAGWRLVRDIAIDKDKGMWGKTLFLVFMLYLFHSQTNVISIGEELMFWLVLGIVGNRRV